MTRICFGCGKYLPCACIVQVARTMDKNVFSAELRDYNERIKPKI